MHTKRIRKDLWEHRRNRTVEIRRPDADGDQGEHVEMACHNRPPAFDKEDAACPYHDHRCEDKLDPFRDVFRDPFNQRIPWYHPTHGENEYGQCQNKTYPELP